MHQNEVSFNGVTRKGMRSTPKWAKQEEETSCQAQTNACGTLKAAALREDPDCPNVVASSVCDTKPVHFLSVACGKVKWIEMEKPCCNPETDEVELLKFSKLNCIDACNNSMGHVDLSGQFRNFCWPDHQFRWWTMFFWALGVILVNAHMMSTLR